MDEELNNQTSKQTSNAMNKISQGASKAMNKINQAASFVSKQIGKAAAKSGTHILANPYFWYGVLIALGIIVGIVLLIILIMAILSLFQIDTFNKDNFTMSSLYGINGDKFYGARFLYKDDETASYEIQDDYLKFTYTILTDSNIDEITLGSDYKNDEIVISIATDFANKLANLPQDETSSPTTENYTFEQSTKIINHFGLKDEEVILVIDSIAHSIKDKGVSKSIDEIKTVLTNAIKNAKYDEYKRVCDKIFVCDYILDKENAFLENIPKRNYIGFVFMPKEDVVIKSTSFRFVVDGGYGVNTLVKFNNNAEISNLIEETNVDVTWYNDGKYKTIDSSEINLDVSKFDAINQSNLDALATPVSIRTLFNEGKFATYFNIEEDNVNAINLMDNIKSKNYLYLTFSSLDAFNFAEYITEY